MKKLSGFDLGIVIAFGVVTLLGAGTWYYLTQYMLQPAQDDVKTADATLNQYSTKYDVVVSAYNSKILQANIDLLVSQLNPLIKSTFLPKENRIPSMGREDPVAWKSDLDNDVAALTALAKTRGVSLPPNFYFGFSRYLSQSPNDDQTAVLSKQLQSVVQITTILFNARVKGVTAIRRTWEEDPHTVASGGGNTTNVDSDRLSGFAVTAPANAYVAYPFEFDFETTSENLRPILNGLLQPPYVFVLRSISIQNSAVDSPRENDLERMAGTPAASMIDSSPGEVAAITSTKGPQYLFGNSTLKVHARIDMIEWTGGTLDTSAKPIGAVPPKNSASVGGTQ
jgi:hypothetical protein